MQRFLPQCLTPSFQVYIWGILFLGRMGSVFVCLVGFGERDEGDTQCSCGFSVPERGSLLIYNAK